MFHIQGRRCPVFSQPTYETSYVVPNHPPTFTLRGSLSLLETVIANVNFIFTESGRLLHPDSWKGAQVLGNGSLLDNPFLILHNLWNEGQTSVPDSMVEVMHRAAPSSPGYRMERWTAGVLLTGESSLVLAQLGFRVKAQISACLLVSVLE